MAKPDKLKKAFIFLSVPAVILALAAVSYFHLLDNYELETLDFRFLLRPKIQTTDKVVLIEIGEDTIERLGRFPFDRSYHAMLVKALSEAGASAVVFDIFFSEPHEHDPDLESAIASAKNVYLPYVFDVDMKAASIQPVAHGFIARDIESLALVAKGTGHINIAPDIDGKFRRVPLLIRYENEDYPYISFLMTCNYLGIACNAVELGRGRSIKLGDKAKIPLDENSNMVINFSGKWGESYKHYSFVDILQSHLASMSGQKPILDMSLFKGKVCIVGLTAAGTVDLHPNPFETLYPGVGIHAEVFNSILTGQFIARASRGANLAILAFLIALVSVITMKMKPFRMLLILGCIIIFFIAAGVLLFNIFGLWIDIFYPVTVMISFYILLTIYKYIGEWKHRVVIENELGIAKKIQESFLPKSLPEAVNVDIAAAMFTARQVGGDLYDFVGFGPDRLGVMIGDVSGKGVPASLFMAMVMGRFRSLASPDTKPQDVLLKLNTTLVKESMSNLFVTVFYSILDMKNMVISYSNGGHLPLIHLSAGGKLEFLDCDEGAPLGLMDGPYVGRETHFGRGDIFVFYTDGITEAMNPRLDMYEKERLSSVIRSHASLSSKALLNAIEKDVRKFEPKASQHDDMTLIAIKIT
ncbi:MAG: CHASE2 domain-containing protein [Candidatus Omnitrophota bacterium]|jgi:CHASE2 domain-containing sensor protein